jgi:soluble lytic murein transglycosylase-like protein
MLTGIFLLIAAAAGFFFLFKGSAQASTGATVQTSSGYIDIDYLILTNSILYDLEIPMIKAFIKVESNWAVYAINPVSNTNKAVSYGLMQITPALAEDFGYVKDHYNPTESEIAQLYVPANNIKIGCRQLHRLFSTHDRDVAIQMYNVGPTGYNSGARNSDYLNKILAAYEEYK